MPLTNPGAGAKVVFGDVSEEPARELEAKLGSTVKFVHCDASSYADQLHLFKNAMDMFSRIDIVVANAGVAQHKDPFAADQDINLEPSMIEIDVNLKGELYSARIGLHYLRENGGGDLVLVSSIAGFKECTGLVTYTASKHGVIGILRGLHLSAVKENIRINAICPWMTSMYRFLTQTCIFGVSFHFQFFYASALCRLMFK